MNNYSTLTRIPSKLKIAQPNNEKVIPTILFVSFNISTYLQNNNDFIYNESHSFITSRSSLAIFCETLIERQQTRKNSRLLYSKLMFLQTYNVFLIYHFLIEQFILRIRAIFSLVDIMHMRYYVLNLLSAIQSSRYFMKG